MFEKIKDSADKLKNSRKLKKMEKEKLRIQQEKCEKELEERIIREEKEKIEAEKARLLSLNDKELKVEMIFALRGFYQEYIELVKSHNEVIERIDGLEGCVSSLNSEIEYLKSAINSISSNFDSLESEVD